MRNIEKLVQVKRKFGRRSPVLNWQFLAFEHNAHEIDAASALARSLGVDQFTVATPFDVAWDNPAIRPAAVAPRAEQFHSDSDQRMIANWNPFPSEIEAAHLKHIFETSWKDRTIPEEKAASAVHTCHYLYKNMVMDATGRILPCCAAPRPDADLVFAKFQPDAADLFNTEKHRLARTFFAFKTAGDGHLPKADSPGSPHCVKCDWYSDQTTAHIDRAQIGRYLKATGAGVFDDKTAQTLTSW
jgi:hypothetical protein